MWVSTKLFVIPLRASRFSAAKYAGAALASIFLVAATPMGCGLAANGNVDQLAGEQARLGFALLQELAGNSPSPVMILDSPASVAAVFAFLDLTADPAMHRALVHALGFAPDQVSTGLK